MWRLDRYSNRMVFHLYCCSETRGDADSAFSGTLTVFERLSASWSIQASIVPGLFASTLALPRHGHLCEDRYVEPQGFGERKTREAVGATSRLHDVLLERNCDRNPFLGACTLRKHSASANPPQAINSSWGVRRGSVWLLLACPGAYLKNGRHSP